MEKAVSRRNFFLILCQFNLFFLNLWSDINDFFSLSTDLFHNNITKHVPHVGSYVVEGEFSEIYFA